MADETQKPACVCYCTRWDRGQKKRAGQGTVTFRWDSEGELGVHAGGERRALFLSAL